MVDDDAIITDGDAMVDVLLNQFECQACVYVYVPIIAGKAQNDAAELL